MLRVGHSADDSELFVEHPCCHGNVETVLVRWETDNDPGGVRDPRGNKVLILCCIPLYVKKVANRLALFDHVPGGLDQDHGFHIFHKLGNKRTPGLPPAAHNVMMFKLFYLFQHLLPSQYP